MWSISNQFGTGQAWVENTRAGSIVSHVSFTSFNGETLYETFTPHQIKIVSGAGSIDIKRLANGHWTEVVFVRPGGCESEPRTMAVAVGATASVELGAHGNPVHGLQSDKFSSAKKVFACGTAAVRSDMRNFMVQAGLLDTVSGSAVPPLLSGLVIPGQLHANVSGACVKAGAELLAAEVGLVGSIAGEGPTGGLDTVVLFFAYAAYIDALQNYQNACG